MAVAISYDGIDSVNKSMLEVNEEITTVECRMSSNLSMEISERCFVDFISFWMEFTLHSVVLIFVDFEH